MADLTRGQEKQAQAAFKRIKRMNRHRRVAYMRQLPEEWRWRVAQLAAGSK